MLRHVRRIREGLADMAYVYGKTKDMKTFLAMDMSEGCFVSKKIYATLCEPNERSFSHLERTAELNKNIGLVLQLRTPEGKVIFQTSSKNESVRMNEERIVSTIDVRNLDDHGMRRCPECGSEKIEKQDYDWDSDNLWQTAQCKDCGQKWTSWWKMKYDTSSVRKRYGRGLGKWEYKDLPDEGFDCPYCHSMNTTDGDLDTDFVKRVVSSKECVDCGGEWDNIYDLEKYVDTRLYHPDLEKKRYDSEQYHKSVDKFWGMKRLKPEEKAELEEIERLHKLYGPGLEIPGYC